MLKFTAKLPIQNCFMCNSVVWSPEAMPKTLLIEINKRNVCASLQKSLQTTYQQNINGPNVSLFVGSVLLWLLMKVRNTP